MSNPLNNELIGSICTSFDNKTLKTFNTKVFFENDKINVALIIKTIFNSKIVIGKINDHSNYKFSYFQPLVEFLVNIIVKHKLNLHIFTHLISSTFLYKINILSKGQIYLQQLKPLIELNLKNIEATFTLNNCARKGTMGSFMFWKNMFNANVYDNEKFGILSNAICNSDDRIYLWFLEGIKKNNNDTYFKNEVSLSKVLEALFRSSIPTKFILKRIRILSDYCNLSSYFDVMVSVIKETPILPVLFKYYYKNPLTNISVMNLVENMENVNSLLPICNLLKTEDEKRIYLIFTVLKFDCSIFIKSFYEVDFVFKNIEFDVAKEILISVINKVKNKDTKSILGLLVNVDCKCKTNCWQSLLYKLCKFKFFHKFIIHEKLPINLQLFTKFLLPFDVEALKVNRILSFLRICAKRKIKSRLINFQMNFYPVMQQILNFTPSNKPVLKFGSMNWQNRKLKFTLQPPRHLLPFEFKNYNNFLLSDKADGILTNNLPINIIPKCDDIVSKMVKAEYIEELELYLVFDIDIKDMNPLERYEFLRNSHPFTKYGKINTIHNMDTLIQEIHIERVIFNKFLSETKDDKIRWYPKASYLVNNATSLFKKEIIYHIIENQADINQIINNYGPYKCDGLILSPIEKNNNLFRDIKIKPKDLMTIDLFFDNNNWLDREKNNYNQQMIKTGSYQQNKVYRCYPICKEDNKIMYEPREIRFDKKHPNSKDIINVIQNIYNFNWNEDYKECQNYYQLSNVKLNKKIINLLEQQTIVLEREVNKLNPENGKNWLDLGCGKGKLIHYIKKYNPKKYLGLDIDTNLLLNNLYLTDENDWISFNPCDISKPWTEQSVWFNLTNYKFDYIVMNFTIMHFFFSDEFWKDLVSVCKPNTKILLNIVSENIKENELKFREIFMIFEKNKIKYFFPWSHKTEVEEDFISNFQLKYKLEENNFKIVDITNYDNNALTKMYDWYQIIKL